MSTILLRLKHLSARNIAIASIALSGAVHLLILPEQLSHSLVHATFFAFLGVAQLLWALFFRWRPAAPIYWAGVWLSGGIVITWFLAFFVSTPYSSYVEPVDAYLLASKILELIGLLALITHSAAPIAATDSRSSKLRLVATPLVASVMFGTMFWGGGELTELLLLGSEHGQSLGADHSHAEGHTVDHEGGEMHHLESLPAYPADIQEKVNAAVEAALLDLEGSSSSADSSGDAPNPVSASGESNLTADSARSPSPVLPPEVQAMVAAAVEAALNPDLALLPTPGPLPVDQGLVTAEAVAADLLHHESEHQHVGGHSDTPAEEPVPISLPERPEPANPLPPPRSVVSTSPPTAIAQPPLQTEWNPPLSPGEEKFDLKIVLFGSALAALILVAVVGAVRTWNEII